MRTRLKKKRAWLSFIMAVSMFLSIFPYGLVQASGNFDSHTPYGIIDTIAGTGTAGYSGDGGAATSAALKAATGVAVDKAGNFYIADSSNHNIRKVDANTGDITTVAGTTVSGVVYSGDGGPAVNAVLNAPRDVEVYTTVTGSVYLYIVDANNFRVRRVDTGTGIITTVAGNGIQGYSGDGLAATDAAIRVNAIAVDGAGNLYIADAINLRVRKVDAVTGIITTVAGKGTSSTYSGENVAATDATMYPYAVSLDSAGNLYIADRSNYRIRVVAAESHTQYGISMVAGNIYTIAGTGTFGYSGDGGTAVTAKIGAVGSLSLDSAGNLYIVDNYSYIRKIDVNGIITTIAGTGVQGYSGDGGLAAKASVNTSDIATDSMGNIYLAEGSSRVRMIYLPLSIPALKTLVIDNSPNLHYDASPVSYDLNNLTLTGTDQLGAAYGLSGQTVDWSIVSGPATVSGSNLTITASGPVKVFASINGLPSNSMFVTTVQSSPAIEADRVANYADQEIELTFSDDAYWRTAITGITVDGTVLASSQYKVKTGKITFPVGVLTTDGDHSIVIKADGYLDASFTQTIQKVTLSAASFAGNHQATNLEINANGLSMTIAPSSGYHFNANAEITPAVKQALIDSMIFDTAYGWVNQNTGAVSKADSTKTNLANLNGIGKAYFGKYKLADQGYDAATIALLRSLDADKGDNYKLLSIYNGEEYVSDFGRFLVAGSAIKEELKARGNVTFNEDGNLVISSDNSGYLQRFTNVIDLVNGGMSFVFGDLPVSLTVPAELVEENVPLKTSNTFDILEIKSHIEIWEYVDDSRAGEPGVVAVTTKYDASSSRAAYSPAYAKTHYIKRVPGDVLTENDVRDGGALGPNGTGKKLVKVVVDGRTGPTWWAYIKWTDPKLVTFAFRTTKDNVIYNTTANTTTPADDSQWAKIENELLIGGPLDASHSAYGYNGFAESNKYVFNASGDWRLDEYDVHDMWYMYEVPQVEDYDISDDQTIYVNQLCGMTGGSGGGGANPQGYPFWGMDGRASFTIQTTDVAVVAVTGVALDQQELTLTAGTTVTLTATVAPANATNKNVAWTTSNPAVATVADGLVTAVAAGTATITVTTEDGSFTANATVTVNPAAVAVTGVALDQQELTLTAGTTGTLTATVAPANATNKNVAWTTSNPAVATVADGLVTAVAAGTATITVTTEDGSFTANATVTVNPAAVAATGVTLDQQELTLTAGTTGALTATVAPANATNKNVAWTTSDATVATVVGGAVTAVGAGTAIITVTTADGSFTASSTVTVNPTAVAVTGVTLDQQELTLAAGTTATLTAAVAPANATNKNITWTTSDATVATVVGGAVTAVGAGTAIITVTTADGSFTASSTVTVNPTAVAVTGVTLDQQELTLAAGTTATLTAAVAPANATNKNITWTTSDATVATVVGGVITAVGAGTATITVTTEDGGSTATSTVIVNPAAVAVTGVTLDREEITLTAGTTSTLAATVAPANATNKNVAWTTSNPAVATVADGVVTAVGAGTATITVTTEDGGSTATSTVIVNPAAVAVTGVTLDREEITLTAGTTVTLTATVAPTNATNKNVTWTSSDKTVATVADGVVTAVGAGTATITVTTEDGGSTATSTVTVNPAAVAVTGVTLDREEITLTAGTTVTLTATVAPTNATNKNVTWTSSDKTVATVADGVVTAVGAGPAIITVTTEDGGSTATSTVTVNPAAVAAAGVTLDQNEITLTAGTTGTLTATVAPANATNKNVTWTTSDPAVATVVDGVVTAVAAGTATITVTTEDGSFTATSKVTVNAAATGGNDEDPDSNPGSITPAGGGSTPATTTQTTTTELGQVTQSDNTVTLQVDAQKAAKVLQDAAQTALVIDLSQVAAESGLLKAVKLPAEAVNLAKTGNKSILIEDSGLKIVIPHEALTQGQDLTFSTAQVSSQPTAPAPEHVELKTVYSFDALAGETAVHNFTQSITITLPIPTGVTEPEKLGIYYLNETTGQWEYVGGRIVDGKLVFTTSHFSTYMLGEYRKTFSDLASHWARTDIEVMAARHVVDGTDADTFAPQTNITRAEFAALLARVLKLSDASGNETFKDVADSEWYANDVKKAAKAGIIQGADGSFRPGDSITRQEMAVMISRAYSYAGGKPDTLKALSFTDNDSISTWASEAVQTAYTLGMINGYPDGSFGALANATRAEGTVMLKTFMDKLGL